MIKGITLVLQENINRYYLKLVDDGSVEHSNFSALITLNCILRCSPFKLKALSRPNFPKKRDVICFPPSPSSTTKFRSR